MLTFTDHSPNETRKKKEETCLLYGEKKEETFSLFKPMELSSFHFQSDWLYMSIVTIRKQAIGDVIICKQLVCDQLYNYV